MSQPLLVTGTIGIDTILTPRNRAEGVLGGSVSFAAVAALLFADRVDAVSIIGEDFPSHYEEALAAKGLCMVVFGLLAWPGLKMAYVVEDAVREKLRAMRSSGRHLKRAPAK